MKGEPPAPPSCFSHQNPRVSPASEVSPRCHRGCGSVWGRKHHFQLCDIHGASFLPLEKQIRIAPKLSSSPRAPNRKETAGNSKHSRVFVVSPNRGQGGPLSSMQTRCQELLEVGWGFTGRFWVQGHLIPRKFTGFLLKILPHISICPGLERCGCRNPPLSPQDSPASPADPGVPLLSLEAPGKNSSCAGVWKHLGGECIPFPGRNCPK